MPVQEGNQVNAASAAPTVNIDTAALGQAIAAGLAPLVQQKTEQKESKLLSTFKSVAELEDTDQGSWGSVKNLVEAGMADLRQEMAHESDAKVTQALAQYRDQSAYQIIRMALDAHIGNDENLIKEKDFLRDRVVHRFNSEDKYKADRARYQTGDIPMEVLKEIAIEEINRLSGRKEKTKPATGMKNNENMLGGEGSSDEDYSDSDNVESVDLSSLTEQEEDLYNARIGTAQRLGHKRDSKEAMALGKRAVLNLRKGQAKAKERGFGRRR